jgi:aryl-alcohol dehydrogenase-like predicted oxidoreductase
VIYQKLGPDQCGVSRIALGCMNFAGHWAGEKDPARLPDRAREAFDAAIENGINFFDHAALYMGGKSESVFGDILKSSGVDRKSIFIQTKFGIRWAGDPAASACIRMDSGTDYVRGHRWVAGK